MQRIKSEISGSEKDVTGELRYKILLRAMTEMGQSRRFDRAPLTSGLPR
jgi:hypothetical protein